MLCPECRNELTPVDLLADRPEKHIRRHEARLIGFSNQHGFHCDVCEIPEENDEWYALTDNSDLLPILAWPRYRKLRDSEDQEVWQIVACWLPFNMGDEDFAPHLPHIEPDQPEQEFEEGFIAWSTRNLKANVD